MHRDQNKRFVNTNSFIPLLTETTNDFICCGHVSYHATAKSFPDLCNIST